MTSLLDYLDEFGTYSSIIQNPNNIFSHLLDLLTLYLAIFIIFIITLGWGQIFRRITGLRMRSHFSSIDVWLGVLLISIFIEVTNFVLPISWVVSMGIVAAGCAAAIGHSSPLRSITNFLRRPWILKFAPFALILAFVLGSKALYTPWSGDNLLYHLNTIRWLNEYPIIPGLGNLHGRLAFNQSYFSFLATINFFPYLNHAPGTGNLFFMVLALITSIEILGTNIKLKLLVFIGMFIAITKYSDTLHSTNSNFITAILQVVIFSQLIILFNAKNDIKKTDQIYEIFYLCVLIFLFKFSSAAFSGITIAILIFRFRKSISHDSKNLLKTCYVISLILVIHSIRGYVLSGAPFYPSTAFHITNLPWSVSSDLISREAAWVMSWARAPGLSPDEVLGNWKWISGWARALPTTFTSTLVIAFFFYIASLIFKKPNQVRNTNQLIYAPLLTSLLFWFLTAPAIGFVGNIPDLIATLSIWIFFCENRFTNIKLIKTIDPKRWLILTILLCLFAIRSTGIKKISLQGWMPIKENALIIEKTKQGLKIYTPAEGDQCGDSPLPCTPYLDDNLHLIGNSINSGFSTKIAN